MKIILHNCWSEVYSANAEQIVYLKDLLTINYHSFIRVKGRNKSVNRQYKLLDGNRIPTGIVPQMLSNTIMFGDTELEDKRQKPLKQDSMSPVVPFPTLWGHQSDAIIECMRLGRGIVEHATGSGKTTTFASLTCSLNVPTLVIVPNLDLLHQTKEVLVKYLGRSTVGAVGGSSIDLSKLITVATTKKFANHGCSSKFTPLRNYDMLILDEAHHVNLGHGGASTLWYNIALNINAYYRFGFTATPGRDGSPQRRLLQAATGRIIHSVGASQLIKNDLLASVEVRVYDIDHGIKIDDWKTAHDTYILGEDRNRKIVELVNDEVKEGRSVLVIVDRVDLHGKILHGLIPNSKFLHGGVDSEIRNDEMETFKLNGGILIGTIFGEGVDLPALDTVVNAAGGKSQRLVTQRMGRALRKDKNNPDKVARIIDFYDIDHGMLQGHARTRLNVYESEPEFTVRRFDSIGGEA